MYFAALLWLKTKIRYYILFPFSFFTFTLTQLFNTTNNSPVLNYTFCIFSRVSPLFILFFVCSKREDGIDSVVVIPGPAVCHRDMNSQFTYLFGTWNNNTLCVEIELGMVCGI